MASGDNEFDPDVLAQLLGKGNAGGVGGPSLEEEGDEVFPGSDVAEEAPPDDDEDYGGSFGGGSDGGGEDDVQFAAEDVQPAAGGKSGGGSKPWEAKRRDAEMPPGVLAPGVSAGGGAAPSGKPSGQGTVLVPPVWDEPTGPELVEDAGRVGVVAGSMYPTMLLDGVNQDKAIDIQVKARLGFLAGCIAPVQAIQENGKGMLAAMAGKPQLASVAPGSAKHTPPTATRNRLPAINNQSPTVVEKAPALVMTGLSMDRMLGGAVPLEGGAVPAFDMLGGAVPLTPTGSWLDEVQPMVPTRQRGQRMDPSEALSGAIPVQEDDEEEHREVGHEGDGGGHGAAHGDDADAVSLPGLPHHRFESGSVPQRKAKGEGPKPGVNPAPKPEPKPEPKADAPKAAPKAPKAPSEGGTGIGRDLLLGGAACLVGGVLAMGWGRMHSGQVRDGALNLVVERRDVVLTYLDTEIAGLEAEIGEADKKLVEATRAMSPEPTVEELKKIEILAREKAQVELLLEVMRARKRGFVEGVRNGGR